MSLRLIYRLVGCLLVALALAGGVMLFAASDASGNAETGEQVSADFRALADIAEATRGSVLKVGGAAVDYVLPPSAEALRILTNANLQSIEAAREQLRADPAWRWHYAIEVEEMDSAGKTLRRRAHHFRRNLVEMRMPDGRSGTGSFYLENDVPLPLPSASLRINFAASVKPARVRIRLLEAAPGIDDILVRVAVPAPSSQRKAETMWRRLSDEQRERLASGNIYPPELLSEQERNSLIASRWQPLGASGEFSGRDIYVLGGDNVGAPVEPPKMPSLMARPDRAAVVQLPEAGGRVRIVLDAENDRGQSSDEVTLRWLGHSAFQRRTSTHPWRTDRFEREQEFDGGWLEINTKRSARVRVWLIGDDGETDITPPVQYLRAWPARNDAPVEFTVSHAGDASTPLRLALRRTGKLRSQPAHTPIEVAFLAGDGKVVHTEQLVPQFAISRYDAPWPEVSGELASEPWEVFFRIPPSVAKLRITSAETVLVNAYSRPAALPREIRMPEDVRSPERARTAIPGWFMLNPKAHEARVLDGNSTLLIVQDHPPEDRPDLLAGRYQWEDFDPVEGGAARVFLAPREAGVPDRRDAAAGTFRPIPEDGVASFIAEPGRSMIAARVAWLAATPGKFPYKIFVDGEEWLRGTTSGRVGEVVLPTFSPGAHRIRIVSEAKVRWYASHLESGAAWTRRRAYRFDEPMHFDIERTTLEEEFVSVRLFRPAGLDSRMKVRARITAPGAAGESDAGDGMGPFPGWLFSERIYDVRPGSELALPVAETIAERTDAGQPFFIPFPKGAPRGRYRITLTPEGGRSWIALSRVTPGGGATPALILESIQDVE